MRTLLYAGTTENDLVPESKNLNLQSISRKEIEYAWLSGVIDSDGYIGIYQKIQKQWDNRYISNPRVSISNTDLRMIKKISEMYFNMGIKFYYLLQKAKRYNMIIGVEGSGSCKKVLEKILPYLVNKKKQAEIALEYIKYKESCRRFQNRENGKMENTLDENIISNFIERIKEEKHIDFAPQRLIRKASVPLDWTDEDRVWSA